jgi:YtcA family
MWMSRIRAYWQGVTLRAVVTATVGHPLSAALCAATLAGCSAAPSHSILGSYFPSWMICALVGLFATVIIRQILVSVGIDRTLPAPLLVYLALAVAGAFATWLIWLDRA